MDLNLLGIVGVVVFIILIALGMGIGFAGALVGFLGLWLVAGLQQSLTALGTLPSSIAATYVFTVIPLFILMGFFSYAAGFATEAYAVGRLWLGWLPGGLASATVFAAAIFAAATGSSTASAAVLTKVALPEMEKYGYQPRLAAAAIACSGTFAVMIPPSALLIIYAIMVEQSARLLLLAGFLPGMLTAIMYVGTITMRCRLNPSLAPPYTGRVTWKERISSLRTLWAVMLLVLVIMGGMYTGIFTPTECGAVGAAGALLIGVITRKISRSSFVNALADTGRTTCTILIVLIGVLIFMRFLAYTRLTYNIVDWMAALNIGFFGMVGMFMGLYLILGMFLNPLSMLVLTMPVLLPLVQYLGWDLVWFGILAVKMGEIAMVTPPVGMTIYAVKAVAPHLSLGRDLFGGILWFVVADVLVLILIIVFPVIALWIPQMAW